MLPDPVVPGATLAAATARALGVAYGPSDPEGVLSDDEDALDDSVGYASFSDVLASVLLSPERAGSMLADHGALTCPFARSEDCVHDGPATPPSTAVDMEVDEGAQWPATAQRSLSPPRELRVAGKRRRLNDVDDEDQRELAELLQLIDEDEAGTPPIALRPSAASALPASVLSVFVHNAHHFRCTLCTYTAASFASLKRHRVTRHRRITFLDRFSAGCACGLPFASRLAAATHAQACASLLSTTSATALTAGGASSHTAVEATATVSAAAITVSALPLQDSSELTASPPLVSSSTVDLQVTDDDDTVPPSTTRWSSPLPRALIASRVAARLDEVPAPRWGPPLPRSVVASRIADRLLPPDLDDEETKEEEDSPASVRAVGDEEEHADGDSGEWLLRFDGACRANPGPGGAGAALFKPSGPVVWTGSHYMPSNGETNNTAEYTALLLGVRAAADHGVQRLRVEGDSILVIRQVRGIFATRSTRLRRLRNAVKAEIARLDCVTLHHVDRQANGHADRLANQALDRRRSLMECEVHPDGSGCTASPTASPGHPAGTRSGCCRLCC